MATPNPLRAYITVQTKYDRELARVLERAARDIWRRIESLGDGIGAEVRKAQLRLVLTEIRNVQQEMWVSGVGRVVRDGRRAAAEASESVAETLTRVLYAALPERVAQTVSDGLKATARAGIERDFARIPRALSTRVYHDFALTSGQVERTIRSGMVSGLSARELAKEVYVFISPTTPGGASYAASRLARTEINNAFHQQQIAGAKRPGVTAAKWNLSGSHPKPDICNQYADQDEFGLGPGMYPPDEVPPSKPHPQCLCFITYRTMNAREFRDALDRGDFDAELDKRTAANLARLRERT